MESSAPRRAESAPCPPRGLAGFLQRRADRLALERAALRGPRLLADMGFDPEQIRRMTGGWDDLLVNELLVRRPR